MVTQCSTSRRLGISLSVTLLGLLAILPGCQGAPDDSEETSEGEVGAAESELVCSSFGSDPVAKEAKRLFEKETFGGNGRTCITCHEKGSGTISPASVAERFAEDPTDPLFLHDGSDDFLGAGTTRVLADATILVRIPLPPNITLANDPTATSVVLRRGVPTLLNTPTLDPVLMSDGRNANLADQASGAIHGHAQSTIEPTALQLDLIAQHQRTSAFFSSNALQSYAGGGPAPGLPLGNNASSTRGRKWFEDAPLPAAINQSTPRKGLCAQCHSGPLLNQTNGFSSLPLAPFPTTGAAISCTTPATQVALIAKGTRFSSALISEFNVGGNPLNNFLLHLPSGAVVPLPPMADPGRALITGNFKGFPSDGDLFKFKIPSLRALKKTAPYFHNNSSKTLQQLVDHYAAFVQIATDCNIDGDPPLIMTAGDKADLLAYLKLL